MSEGYFHIGGRYDGLYCNTPAPKQLMYPNEHVTYPNALYVLEDDGNLHYRGPYDPETMQSFAQGPSGDIIPDYGHCSKCCYVSRYENGWEERCQRHGCVHHALEDVILCDYHASLLTKRNAALVV